MNILQFETTLLQLHSQCFFFTSTMYLFETVQGSRRDNLFNSFFFGVPAP